MKGLYKVGDRVFVKTTICRVAMLGKIETIEGAHGVIRLIFPIKGVEVVNSRLDLLDPHDSVIKRWSSREEQKQETRLKKEIDDLMREIGAKNVEKINHRLY